MPSVVKTTLRLLAIINLIILPSIFLGSLLYQLFIAMDVDMEVLIQLEHAFENARLFFYGLVGDIKFFEIAQ